MASNFTVSLARLIKEFSLESIYLPQDPAEIMISSSEVNRPGLLITGFKNYFDPDRIQIIGKMENAYGAHVLVKNAARWKQEGFVVDHASIEDILLYIVKRDEVR